MTIIMPEIAKVSIFIDNDLTDIADDHFKIKLITRLLDKYMSYSHLCCQQGMMMHHQVNMNIHNSNTIWAHYTLTGYYPTLIRLP